MSIKGTQGEQLRMFMTARELKNDLIPGDAEGYGGGAKEMWASKSEENKVKNWKGEVPLGANVVKSGVKNPVEIMHDPDLDRPAIWDGHHRTQAAFEHDPDSYVPVTHHDMGWNRAQWAKQDAQRNNR